MNAVLAGRCQCGQLRPLTAVHALDPFEPLHQPHDDVVCFQEGEMLFFKVSTYKLDALGPL